VDAEIARGMSFSVNTVVWPRVILAGILFNLQFQRVYVEFERTPMRENRGRSFRSWTKLPLEKKRRTGPQTWLIPRDKALPLALT